MKLTEYIQVPQRMNLLILMALLPFLARTTTIKFCDVKTAVEKSDVKGSCR